MSKVFLILSILKFVIILSQFAFGVIIANLFGASSSLDVYFAILTLTTSLNVIFLEAQGKAFIPYLSSLVSENNRKSQTLTILKWNGIFFFILTLLMIALSPIVIHVLAPGFSVSQMQLGISLIRIMAISILFININGILKSYLEFNNSFITAGLIEAQQLITTILGVVLFYKNFGLFVLPLSSIVAQFITFLFYGVAFGKRLLKPFSFLPKMDSIKPYLYLATPVFLSAGLSSLSVLSETFIGSYLPTNSISYYSYAGRIVRNLPLLFVPISTLFYPVLSRAFAQNNENLFNNEFKKGFSLLFFIVVPVAFFLGVFAQSIIDLLFLRGNFTLQDARITAKLLQFQIMVLICGPFGLYFSNAIFSRNKMKAGAFVSIISSFIIIVFNFVFTKFFGIIGIAIGTSCGLLMGNILQIYVLRKSTPGELFAVRNHLKIGLCVCFAIAIVKGISILLFINGPVSQVNNIIQLGFLGTIYAAIYLFLSIRSNIPSAKEVWTAFVQKTWKTS